MERIQLGPGENGTRREEIEAMVAREHKIWLVCRPDWRGGPMSIRRRRGERMRSRGKVKRITPCAPPTARYATRQVEDPPGCPEGSSDDPGRDRCPEVIPDIRADTAWTFGCKSG